MYLLVSILSAPVQPTATAGWLLPLFSIIASGGFLGALGSLFYVRATGRKLNAETHKYGVDADVSLSGQALEWVKEARDASVKADAKAERAEMKTDACRAELDALRDHVSDVLEPMMRQNGMTPPPFVWPR